MELSLIKARLKKRVFFKASSYRDVLVLTSKSLLFLFFLILFFSNIQKKIFQEKTSINPKISRFYFENANDYLNKNNFYMANYLNNFGLYVFPGNIDLLKQKDLISFKENERFFVEKDLNDWLRVSKIHPDYRDAYAQISFLYLKLGDEVNAKIYLRFARSIDPNWPSLSRFDL